MGAWHKIGLPILGLFLALFRMAYFIMLPQSSPITSAIVGYLPLDTRLGLARITSAVGYVDRTARRSFHRGYQIYEAVVASFLPWLLFAMTTSTLMILGRLGIWIVYWMTILPKLWLRDSEHRSILRIFADPTRRKHLSKTNSGWKKANDGKWEYIESYQIIFNFMATKMRS